MSHRIVNIYAYHDDDVVRIQREHNGHGKLYLPSELSRTRLMRTIGHWLKSNKLTAMSNRTGTLFWFNIIGQ